MAASPIVPLEPVTMTMPLSVLIGVSVFIAVPSVRRFDSDNIYKTWASSQIGSATLSHPNVASRWEARKVLRWRERCAMSNVLSHSGALQWTSRVGPNLHRGGDQRGCRDRYGKFREPPQGFPWHIPEGS